MYMYSTSQKKVKVPGDWFARDSLAVRSRFGRGSVGVRSRFGQGSVGERGTVRLGTVRCARK